MVVVSMGTAVGQNPIIKGQFTADPTARVFNGRMYLYPSHDIESPIDEPEGMVLHGGLSRVLL